MNAAVSVTNHPNDETLAAFVDGRLDAAAREEVMKHTVDCAECRDVVLLSTEIVAAEGGAEVVRPRFGRRVFPLLAAAAAAVIVLVLLTPLLRDRTSNEIATLVEASKALGTRPVDGRLAGFPYKPKKRTYRSGDDTDKGLGELRMDAAVAQVVASTAGEQTARSYHAAGIAHLYGGNPDLAVRALEEAVRRSANEQNLASAIAKTTDAVILSDLSAAYYARGVARDVATDFTAALDAAERAWRLKQSPEIAWNRAVALSHYGVRGAAQAAWDDFLRLNEDPLWADEARKRRTEQNPVSHNQQWHELEPQLLAWIRTDDRDAFSDAVMRFPAHARTYFESVALIAWANERGSGRLDGNAWSVVEALASELARTGERYPLDVAASIERACRRGECDDIASAHLGFAGARLDMEAQKYGSAKTRLEAAAQEFARLGSPYQHSARFERLVCAIHRNDFDTARLEGHALLDAVKHEPYPTLHGRMLWLIGLCELQALRPEEALERYLAAEKIFDRMRDKGNLAALQVRVADALEFVGDAEEATSYRLRALQSMRTVGDSKDYGLMMFEAGYAAYSRGFRFAADALLEEAIVRARESGRPDLGVMAALWRATNFAQIGDIGASAEQLHFAKELSAAVADDTVRERLSASAGAILGRTELARRPRQDLTEAIEFFERTGAKSWIPHLLRHRANVLVRAGDRTAAERDLRRAITVAEDVLGGNAGAEVRHGFTAEVRGAYTDLITILLADGRSEAALEVAERARLIGRITANERPSLRHLARTLAPSAQVAVFEVQSSSLIVWLVTRDEISMFASPATPAEIDRALRAAQSRPSNAALADLYDILMRPWITHAHPSSELAIAPAPSLEAVPFAALFDQQRGRHVIDDFVISTTGSITEFVNAPPFLPERNDRMVVVADAAYRRMERLPSARTEASDIGALYPGATILTGGAATAPRFLEELRSATMLHFAGHAVLNEHVPRMSALAVADQSDSNDGRVYVHELLARRLPLKLVVLSACSTAQRGAGEARGNITIARAFLDGGAKAVVATLRPVSDDAAAAFSVAFHRTLRRGVAPAAAVRAAQIHVRANPSFGLEWAAFSFMHGALDTARRS